MGKVFIILDDELEHRLRVAIVALGGKRGDLSATMQEAAEDWLKKHSREIKRAVRM